MGEVNLHTTEGGPGSMVYSPWSRSALAVRRLWSVVCRRTGNRSYQSPANTWLASGSN